MSRLDHDMRLHRAGYLTAAMGRRLPADAPPAFAHGYHSWRVDDAAPGTAALERERVEVLARLYRDGLLTERRRGFDSSAHRYRMPRNLRALALYAAGLATAAMLRALGGAA